MPWQDLFNVEVGVPSWVTAKIEEMSPNDLEWAAYTGGCRWKLAVYQVLEAEAGVLPSGIMTEWRQYLTDSRSHLEAVCQALGLVPAAGLAAKEMLPVVLRVISKGPHHSVLDKVANGKAADEWLRRLLWPALVMAKEQNRPRLESLVGNTGVHLPPKLAMTIKILHRIVEAGEEALRKSKRPDNPYSFPDAPASNGALGPAILPIQRSPSPPAKRLRLSFTHTPPAAGPTPPLFGAFTPTCLCPSPRTPPAAGPSRLPLGLLPHTVLCFSPRTPPTAGPSRMPLASLSPTRPPQLLINYAHILGDIATPRAEEIKPATGRMCGMCPRAKEIGTEVKTITTRYADVATAVSSPVYDTSCYCTTARFA
ncbi:hypothetical protein B0H17DRAFT_1190757 [Mycena rosella]|uniref:Uncharacterized protein n=1 Tax=Mycena rosella TaxID=1033263 RepID=A0AAD7H0K3_MYCRO|nr:hypothetical protein B0H17DRAFT_1190757 [Mycena rosella]